MKTPLTQAYWFETLQQPGLSGGSKFKAYIRARSRTIEDYRGRFCSQIKSGFQPYNCRLAYRMFAAPQGFLP